MKNEEEKKERKTRVVFPYICIRDWDLFQFCMNIFIETTFYILCICFCHYYFHLFFFCEYVLCLFLRSYSFSDLHLVLWFLLSIEHSNIQILSGRKEGNLFRSEHSVLFLSCSYFYNFAYDFKHLQGCN